MAFKAISASEEERPDGADDASADDAEEEEEEERPVSSEGEEERLASSGGEEEDKDAPNLKANKTYGLRRRAFDLAAGIPHHKFPYGRDDRFPSLLPSFPLPPPPPVVAEEEEEEEEEIEGGPADEVTRKKVKALRLLKKIVKRITRHRKSKRTKKIVWKLSHDIATGAICPKQEEEVRRGRLYPNANSPFVQQQQVPPQIFVSEQQVKQLAFLIACVQQGVDSTNLFFFPEISIPRPSRFAAVASGDQGTVGSPGSSGAVPRRLQQGGVGPGASGGSCGGPGQIPLRATGAARGAGGPSRAAGTRREQQFRTLEVTRTVQPRPRN